MGLISGGDSRLAKKSAGPATPSACTQSACTATRPVHIPTFQGSDAPVSMVDEDPTQGSHALEGWWSQVRVHPEDLPRLASKTPKTCSGCQAPFHSLNTQRGYAPVGTDPYS